METYYLYFVFLSLCLHLGLFMPCLCDLFFHYHFHFFTINHIISLKQTNFFFEHVCQKLVSGCCLAFAYFLTISAWCCL